MDAGSRVDSYATPLDAELARAYLESHQIAARLEGEETMGAAYALQPALGAVRLFVDTDHEQRARALLAQYHQAQRERFEATRESSDERVMHAWGAALFGVVILPVAMQIYSALLLWKVDRQHLSVQARRRYVAAWVLDLIMFFVAIVTIAKAAM